MSTGAQRDAAELRDGVSRWVRSAGDLVPGFAAGGVAPEVMDVSHADAGMANETVLVDLGRHHSGIVLRLESLDPTFPHYDLSTQAVVQNAVAHAGVPAPSPCLYVPDPAWIGAPFLVMPRVNGFIPGGAPVFDQTITGASLDRQRLLHDGFIDALVKIHGVDWATYDLGQVLGGSSVAAALDSWDEYVAWAGEGEPLPVLLDALSWCRREWRGQDQDDVDGPLPTLLWGDPRLGNLVFDHDGAVHAVLDWDLAAIGPPEMDLGWYFGLEFMMEQLFDQRVAGFPQKAAAVERYEERSGHEVIHLDWHEVFALTRALAINDRHQRVTAKHKARLSGGGGASTSGRNRRTENPMIAILAARMQATE